MGLLGLSEHTPKGLWSRKSEYEYVNMTLTTLGCREPVSIAMHTARNSSPFYGQSILTVFEVALELHIMDMHSMHQTETLQVMFHLLTLMEDHVLGMAYR